MNEIIQVKQKKCPNCKQTKPLSEYHKHNTGFMGVQNHCKTCRNKGGSCYSMAAYEIRNKLKIDRPPIGTPCEICGDTEKKLFFDHCHVTKEFRGWLCSQCNYRLGNMGDIEEKIKENYEKIMKYLKKY